MEGPRRAIPLRPAVGRCLCITRGRVRRRHYGTRVYRQHDSRSHRDRFDSRSYRGGYAIDAVG